MKLKDSHILEFSELFESALNRCANLDKQHKIRLRRKIRNELHAMLAFEIASANAVMNRWEDKLYEVFLIAPYGFKEELLRMIISKFSPAFARKVKQSS